MSRTFRNKTPRQDRWADDYDDDALSQRRAARLRKGADGVVSTSISPAAKEGVYTACHDEVPRGYGKRMSHKDMRRHDIAMVKAGLKESSDED